MGRIRLIINRILLKFDLIRRSRRLLSSPIEIQLEPTNRCNLACGMCIRNIYKREMIDISFDNFKKIIDKLPYVKFITLHGWGEPLLNCDLFKMINYAHGKGIITAFATNGCLLSHDISVKLLNSGLDKLVFSIDASQDYLFNSIRKNAHLEEVISNIRYLCILKKKIKNKSLRLGISTTILKENVDHLDGILRLAKDLDIPEVSFHPGYYYNQGICNVLGLDKSDIKRILNNLRILGKTFNIKVEFHTFQFGNKLCTTPWFLPFIAANGDIFVCCYQKEPLGNILKQEFRDIWNNQSYAIFREGIKYKPNDICKYCPYLRV